MENPIKNDDLGVPLFLETSIWTNNIQKSWASKTWCEFLRRHVFFAAATRISSPITIVCVFFNGTLKVQHKSHGNSTYGSFKTRQHIFIIHPGRAQHFEPQSHGSVDGANEFSFSCWKWGTFLGSTLPKPNIFGSQKSWCPKNYPPNSRLPFSGEPSLRIQVCPKKGITPIHSYSFRMGLEHKTSYSRKGPGFLGAC